MYLWDISTRERRVTLSGHTGRIFTAVFSYDGSRIASISYDKTIRVWNTHTGELQSTFDRQGADGLTFLPDGSLRACGGWKGPETLRVWDVYTEESVTPEISRGLNPGLNTVVAFSPDKKIIAIGTHRGGISLWRADTGEHPLYSTRAHAHDVTTLAFSPDGSLLASGSYDNTIRLWEAATGEQLALLTGHTNALSITGSAAISTVSFSPNRTSSNFDTTADWDLASASHDGTILLWNLAPYLAQIPWDVNADGVVNILDLTFIASRFGENSPDLNGDGIVNILDLILVANHIGE